MQLILVRHGEAVSPMVHKDRPLSSTGEAQVERLAAMLDKANIKMDKVYHSGILRAQQTAETLAKSILKRGEPQILKGLHPNDDPEALVTKTLEWATDTMLVGHLPYMERLASLLVMGHERWPMVYFQTATAAALQYTGGNHWTIEWVLSPAIIK